jgi:hypothetical protein
VAQVSVEILVTRDELDALIAELAALHQALAGSAGDPSELIAIGETAGESSFLAADRGRRPLPITCAVVSGSPSAPGACSTGPSPTCSAPTLWTAPRSMPGSAPPCSA